MLRAGQQYGFVTFLHRQPQGQMLFEYFLSSVVCLSYTYCTYSSFCFTSNVSRGCDSAVCNPVPDGGGIQYDWSFSLSFSSWLVPMESTSSLNPRWSYFKLLKKYTEHNTVCVVSVPWSRLQLPHCICSVSSSEIKHASNNSNKGQSSDVS